jgi:hypothetical protein
LSANEYKTFSGSNCGVCRVSIATIIGPDAMTAPTAAQNMTGDNAAMMGGGKMTLGNETGGNWTKSKIPIFSEFLFS